MVSFYKAIGLFYIVGVQRIGYSILWTTRASCEQTKQQCDQLVRVGNSGGGSDLCGPHMQTNTSTDRLIGHQDQVAGPTSCIVRASPSI